MHVNVSLRGLFSIFRSRADVNNRIFYLISPHNKTNRFPSFANPPRRGTMEQAATDAGSPGNVNPSVPAEKAAAVEATDTGKRKNDETGDSETNGSGKRRRGAGGKKLRPGERYIPPPQKRNPGLSFSQEHFKETSYYFEGGLRKVYPYYFDFKTYCKGRWIGKSLLDVFNSEFRAESTEYYQKAAKEGRICLNQTPVEDLSVVLRVSLMR